MIGIAAAAGAAYLAVKRSPPPEPAVSAYVDSAACAGCHAEIAASYAQTGMGRSFYPLRPNNVVENFAVGNSLRHEASRRTYTMVQRDGKFYMRRHQYGHDGKETNVVEKRIDYVMGSGNHARTYLHRTPEGKLAELPVSWYTERGGYWAMSPGYDRPGHRDFRRAITTGCMFCHNGYPQNPAPEQLGSEAVFAESLPQGIDCQRCHGPGGGHIAAVAAGKAGDKVRASIINPATLSRDRQLDVCMQCHLETTSSALPNEIVRFERTPYSYVPGEALGDFALFFDHAPGKGKDDKFEIAHAAYRLRQSACFAASDMTCTTCHNPHSVPRGEPAAEHYQAVCRTCHQATHEAGAAVQGNCVDCHMPKRRSEDAVHVVMTDHYIQRRKPPGDLLAPRAEAVDPDETAYRGEVVLYYPPQAGPADEIYLAVAQVRDGVNLEAGIPRLRAAIEAQQPRGPEFSSELAKAYQKAGDLDEAIRYYEVAIARDADFAPAVRGLAVALSGRQPARAAALLSSIDGDSAVLANLANLYLRTGDAAQASAYVQQALAKDPDVAEAHNVRGLLSLQAGDADGAERGFREAIRIEPELAEAQSNLANLLAEGGDFRQARYHFERAVKADPDNAETRRRYGLLLIVTGDYGRALSELGRAVELDPSVAQAHSDLGDILAASGRIGDAVAEYETALRLDPNLYEAHLALGALLADRGDAAAARAHLEAASSSADPQLRGAALEILGSL